MRTERATAKQNMIKKRRDSLQMPAAKKPKVAKDTSTPLERLVHQLQKAELELQNTQIQLTKLRQAESDRHDDVDEAERLLKKAQDKLSKAINTGTQNTPNQSITTGVRVRRTKFEQAEEELKQAKEFTQTCVGEKNALESKINRLKMRLNNLNNLAKQ